jgi:hypothetical protein
VVGCERRKYRRLPVGFGISCRRADAVAGRSHSGRTVNVGPGGLYFQTREDVFQPGDLLDVKLSIPPTMGLLESGGQISGLARVLRTEGLPPRASGVPEGYGVALEFCQSLRLRT